MTSDPNDTMPDEFDIAISVTHRVVAVQISDRSTDQITHEQNDLDDLREALDYIERVTSASV
ncbi:hypothetical protein PP564_13040 [Mycobacteroides abscessus]|uniref:hypothetical protein n=1 Tax=Mycobacteroides abscessus TaxID=36809 RepID=UPI000C26AB11|nr:hypothetical protein [Mycobacteroides abscessus]MDM2496028.1 hypothetical protein [Mycobacteroides abscessus]MDM2514613.1 hypothetical protein [Mycobacteroides abscessus]MDM2523599.1 hypothetical protein [Mycobacteroides abscessus]MDM2529774.1 hypothetical protein [Mycobacteroides abscessus]MDM2531373.1 hypothetical protein [Mycobacteroides abscessus]